MQFNSVLFPAPENYYTNRRARDIIYIPVPPVSSKTKTSENLKETQEEKKKDDNSAKNLKYIPCLYLPYPPGSNKVLVYFHGNGEDIGYSNDFLNILKIRLRVHILAVEYPGYSLYIGSPNANQICQDAEIVYNYINEKIGIPEENIILFGRSIGSGPATHLAARKSPSALILMSPYTSIGAVVKNIVGSFGKLFVAERFKNIDEITKVRCPILFIHGLLDQLIPKDHSVSLLNACPQTVSHIMFSETMTHNEFDMDDDIINPFKKFLTNCQIKIVNEKLVYEFPPSLYDPPKCWANKANKRSFMSKFYEKLAE